METALRLEFTRLTDQGRPPTRARSEDAAFDLHAAEPAVLAPGERASVGTGIAIAIPQRHGGLVLPRSGLAHEHGIALVNSPGLIDPGYRGEVRVLLLNTDQHETFTVEVGDRIAQLLVVASANSPYVEVDQLDDTERGGDGFGSTGK